MNNLIKRNFLQRLFSPPKPTADASLTLAKLLQSNPALSVEVFPDGIDGRCNERVFARGFVLNGAAHFTVVSPLCDVSSGGTEYRDGAWLKLLLPNPDKLSKHGRLPDAEGFLLDEEKAAAWSNRLLSLASSGAALMNEARKIN